MVVHFEATIPWKQSVWFFDVDDTLINTRELTAPAARAMLPVLDQITDHNTAQKIVATFISNYNLLMVGHSLKTGDEWADLSQKTQHEAYIQAIEEQQPHLIEQGLYKKWSREIFVKIAAQQHGVSLQPDQVLAATAAYWIELSLQSALHPGVLDIFKVIKKHQRPVFLVTGSDANLTFDEHDQFEYDATYSASYKLRRVMALKQLGIEFDGVITGDPIDKPHKEFFLKALDVASKHLGQTINPNYVIMVGDSYHSDLHTPKTELQFGLVIQLNKQQETMRVIDTKHVVVNNLADIGQFLKG